MRKNTHAPQTSLQEESSAELATEIIELSCHELDSLTHVFKLLTSLCQELHDELQTSSLDLDPLDPNFTIDSLIDIPEDEIH